MENFISFMKIIISFKVNLQKKMLTTAGSNSAGLGQRSTKLKQKCLLFG